MLYLIVILLSVIALAFVIAVLLPLPIRDFKLSADLDREELFRGVRAIAAKSRSPKKGGEKLETSLMERYCRVAEKIVETRLRTGIQCEEYELRFSENYHVMTSAFSEIKKCAEGFAMLPYSGKAPAIYDLLSFVVKSHGGRLDESFLREIIAVYNTERPLCWSEICNIKPMLAYALLEQLTVYASKIIKRQEIKERAIRDAGCGIISYDHLGFNSYIKLISTLGDENYRIRVAEVCSAYGIDPDISATSDARRLASYCGGVAAVCDSLRADFFTPEYLLSISLSAQYLENDKNVNFRSLSVRTKCEYMSEIEREAARRKTGELERTRQIVSLSRVSGKDLARFVVKPPLGKKWTVLQILTVIVFALASSITGAIFLVPVFKILTAILCFPVFVGVYNGLYLYIAGKAAPRRIVPELAVSPEKAPLTAIVCCRAVKNSEDVEEAFKNIVTTAEANRGSCFSYGLLLDRIGEEYARINEDISRLYGRLRGKEHFFICLRKNAWERKRGALLQFNDLILHGESEPFGGIWGNVHKFEYVLTIDADTSIMNSARLIGIMEHPFNADKTIVNIGMRSRISGLTTPFARLMCGERGMTYYSDENIDVIFNLYGSGNYTGKGIYRVEKFNETLRHILPEKRILSHDFIEGAYAGCGGSGISGIDDFPLTYSSYVSRQMRWMRGDLQLMPWLMPRVRNDRGEKVKNSLGVLPRWQIFSNINAVIFPVCALALLVLTAVTGWYWLLLAAFLPQAVRTVLALNIGWRNPDCILKEEARQLWQALQLPAFGLCCLMSFIITSFRLISGRNLLCWKTYSAGGGKHSFFIGNILLSVLFLVSGIIWFSPAKIVLAAVFLLVFPVDAFLSRADKQKEVSAKLKSDTLELARRTWSFFEETLTEKNNYLPCDNIQYDKGWADRTSPTNIAMALSSAVAACKIGIISESRRDELIGKILRTLTNMEKYSGCPYNWYEVSTLRPLPPLYVSSVDCGNLLASLLLISALGGVNARLSDALIDDMRADFLFDAKRGLLRIGYNASTAEFDGGHYDLLGSEAMLSYLVFSACGDLPYESYANLSRRTLKNGKNVLASWTGGMFEYLLPTLYFSMPEYSLLGKNAGNVIQVHAKYSESTGSDIRAMSESLYGEYNDNGDYRYHAFGVRTIALTSQDCRNVFAPYADVMAVSCGGKADVGRLLDKYSGAFGLYDSVDRDAASVQKASMAHHQGMIMMSACNVLCGNVLNNMMQNDGRCRAAALLLEENSDALKCAKKKDVIPGKIATVSDIYWKTSSRTTLPQLAYFTNGEYCLVMDECGRNFQYCRDVLLTRFDRMSGLRLFIEREGVILEPAASSDCRFTTHYAEYCLSDDELSVEVYSSVLFDCNGEIRRLNLINTSKKSISMSVIVAAKPCLTSRDSDLSHKAFSSMFVETFYDDSGKFVYAGRTNTGNNNVLALFCNDESEYVGDERYLIKGSGPVFGRTTEPILACRTEVEVPPRASVTLSYFMSYGTLSEIRGRRKMLYGFNPDYSGLRLSVLSSLYFLPYYIRNLGSYLLFKKGRKDGVLPCVTLKVNKANIDSAVRTIGFLKTLRKFGAEFSTVIFYDEPVSYFMELSDRINSAVVNLGGNYRIINELTADPAEIEELKRDGIDCLSVKNVVMPPYYKLPPKNYPSVSLSGAPKTEYALGIGGFGKDSEYIFTEETPSPWCNVMSDGRIGCVISDKGGFTFGSNSRQEKFTRHSNDELNDEHGDGIILGEGGTMWSVTRNPLPRESDYSVIHNFGYSEFKCGFNGMKSSLTVYVAGGVKYYDIVLENALAIDRTVDVMCFAELVLGDHITRTMGGIVFGTEENSIFARNGELKLYMSSSERLRSKAYYAESYRDRSWKIRVCAELENDGCTPALAYSVTVGIKAKEKRRVVFGLSVEKTAVSAAGADEALLFVKRAYSGLADYCVDEAPIKYYVQWLAYQTLVSRFTAKCGFQQVGGAVGFRDQLQDSIALLGIEPEKVRAHIIDCAAHQFESGDVMHWWHKPSVGVRTRICDDRLFLPLALCEYVEYTGDNSLLEEQAYYLKDKPLPENEHSVYAYMECGSVRDSILRHAIKAINSVRLSDRDLVLIGGGDWNDGMDKLGEKGRGESVWCSMFLYYVIGRLSPYVDERTATDFRALRVRLIGAVEECFDKDRYVRAFTDGGDALGVEESPECKIDLLVQSWAVLSGLASGDRAKLVLTTAYDRLVDKEHGIIRLLDPPFSRLKVGYISEYPLGVRENGGQYTHAAVWYIWALYEAGLNDKANELLEMILPCNHTADKLGVETYLKEPYVLAGDVYDGELAGRAGWTWYTGAAGWLYRLIKEKYYGLKITAEGVKITPGLPCGKLVRLRVKLNGGGFTLTIDSRNKGKWKTFVGARGYEGGTLPMKSLAGKSVLVQRQKSVD